MDNRFFQLIRSVPSWLWIAMLVVASISSGRAMRVADSSISALAFDAINLVSVLLLVVVSVRFIGRITGVRPDKASEKATTEW